MKNRIGSWATTTLLLAFLLAAGCSSSGNAVGPDAAVEVRPDLPGPDLAGPDLAGPDVSGPDLGEPDRPSVPEAAPDLAPDLWSGAEAARGEAALPDVAPELARDLPVDPPGADVSVDLPPDTRLALDLSVDVPAPVDTLGPTSGLVQVTVGAVHACGLKTDGTAVCWATGDFYDQPKPPEAKLKVISAGGNHTCGLRTDGTLICWGENNGQGPTAVRDLSSLDRESARRHHLHSASKRV